MYLICFKRIEYEIPIGGGSVIALFYCVYVIPVIKTKTDREENNRKYFKYETSEKEEDNKKIIAYTEMSNRKTLQFC